LLGANTRRVYHEVNSFHERADAAQSACPRRPFAGVARETMMDLFGVRLPAMAAELAAGRTGLGEGVRLYHMLLEGVVSDAGQHALLDDLADGALPGVREGVERVELDERWHVGFGLRCLIEAQPSEDLLDDLLARAQEAAAAWGDAVPAGTREHSARRCARRLQVAGLIQMRAAA
jgi:ribonucleoside-diphosphate reductase beta chain